MVKHKLSANSSGSRFSRRSEQEEALMDALATPVPEKNTGPDPDDILTGIFETEPEETWSGRTAKVAKRRVSVQLDEEEVERAEQILRQIQQLTGEYLDIEDVLKMALVCCPLDEDGIEQALKKVRVS